MTLMRREYQARWAREKRASETPEQREERLALRRAKRGLKPRGQRRPQADYNREYYQRNRDELLERNRQWRLDNQDRMRALRMSHEAARRARKNDTQVDGCPRVRAIYALAAALRAEGRDVHVDHIVPLSKGGEHVIGNLRIIPAIDNLRKGARI